MVTPVTKSTERGGESIDEELRRIREAIVHRHMSAEIAGDVSATLATFTSSPEYDIVPLGELRRGADQVGELLGDLLTAFPDLGLYADIVRHAEDAVVIEGRMTGTHRGCYAGFAPTGAAFEIRSAVFFTFDGQDLRRETVYYDELTLLRQLGCVGNSA